MNMLKAKLNKKLGKNGGFTLVEMLIVVAIIAILVAVSIPLVSTSLDKAKKATDDANLRAAKAEASLLYMNEEMKESGDTNTYIANGWFYDIDEGTFKSGSPANGYNKTDITGGPTAGNGVITVAIPGTGTAQLEVKWVTKS